MKPSHGLFSVCTRPPQRGQPFCGLDGLLTGPSADSMLFIKTLAWVCSGLDAVLKKLHAFFELAAVELLALRALADRTLFSHGCKGWTALLTKVPEFIFGATHTDLSLQNWNPKNYVFASRPNLLGTIELLRTTIGQSSYNQCRPRLQKVLHFDPERWNQIRGSLNGISRSRQAIHRKAQRQSVGHKQNRLV